MKLSNDRIHRPNRFILYLFSYMLSFGMLLAIATTTSFAQEVDTTPPQLVNFSFSPSLVDVSAGPQTITATFDVTDDLAGVSYAWVNFRSPSMIQYQYLYAYTFISGDVLEGTLEGTLSLPQFSENGTWTVESVSLGDHTGNYTYIYNDTLQSMGFPAELIVVSDPTDMDGPTLTGLTISPGVIDVSDGPQEITISLDLTDNLSGVFLTPPSTGSFLTFFAMELRSPSGQQSRFLGNRDFTQISGTLLDGTWRATLTMPQYSESGAWQIAYIYVYDLAANSTYLWASRLQELGFTTGLGVISNTSDVTPPEVTGLSFSPAFINTSSSFQNVTVTLNITDDLSGVNFSRDTTNISYFFGVSFRSPSGGQWRYSGWLNLVDGDLMNGTWEGSAFFPRYSEDGTWRVSQVIIKDATRNVLSLDTASLQAKNFPTNLVIIRPSLIGDGTLDSGGGTVIDDTFGERAQVIAPPGILPVSTNVSIDVFQDPLDIPMPSGYLSPGTLFVNIDLTPEPSFPLPSPGLTVILPLPNPLPAGTLLDLFKVDPGTGSLLPAVNVLGDPVKGTVDPDGLSATFTGIASLSTVVGLIPVADEDGDGDGVDDLADQCLTTPIGEVVDANGCAIVDLCPCANDWKNHGDYVSCVARTAKRFVASGFLTEEEKGAIVSVAGESTCGHKQ